MSKWPTLSISKAVKWTLNQQRRLCTVCPLQLRYRATLSAWFRLKRVGMPSSANLTGRSHQHRCFAIVAAFRKHHGHSHCKTMLQSKFPLVISADSFAGRQPKLHFHGSGNLPTRRGINCTRESIDPQLTGEYSCRNIALEHPRPSLYVPI